MIEQTIKIDEIGWVLRIYYSPKPNQCEYLLDELFRAGCVGKNYHRATMLLKSGAFNSGLTYTNKQTRETIIIVGRSSDFPEFVNTLTHEINHFIEHVMEELGIEGGTEDEAYFTGELYELLVRNTIRGIKALLL